MGLDPHGSPLLVAYWLIRLLPSIEAPVMMPNGLDLLFVTVSWTVLLSRVTVHSRGSTL